MTEDELKSYKGFAEIDKKIKFISDNRKYCDAVIKELNDNIDLDFVKQSELIENNVIPELKGVHLKDVERIWRVEQKFPIEALNYEIGSKEYENIMEENRMNSSLLVRYLDKDGKIKESFYKTPANFQALNIALTRARNERSEIKEGKKPILDAQFIKDLNGLTALENYSKFGPFFGLGEFRHTVVDHNGSHKMPVSVEGALWQATDSDFVEEEMNKLIDEYNSLNIHPIAKALIFKTKFIHIHPFRDGNGRTSRLLLNYMLIRYGYPTITIKANQKFEYFDAIDDAINNNDYSKLVDMITIALNKRCDNYIDIIYESKNDKNINN